MPDHSLMQDNRLRNATKKHGHQERYFTQFLWSRDGKCSHLTKERLSGLSCCRRFLQKYLLTLPWRPDGSWDTGHNNWVPLLYHRAPVNTSHQWTSQLTLCYKSARCCLRWTKRWPVVGSIVSLRTASKITLNIWWCVVLADLLSVLGRVLFLSFIKKLSFMSLVENTILETAVKNWCSILHMTGEIC